MTRRLPAGTLLLGIDVGATRVRVHEVQLRASAGGGPTRPLPGLHSAQAHYAKVARFTPVPLARQIVERATPHPGALERRQGEAWIAAIAACCLEVARARDAKEALIGACAPGLKSADARGIEVSAHGPRIPDFLDRLEAALRQGGLGLAAPVTGLLSDGDACGMGEEASTRGAFRDVANAYYVGSGTGLAEALKLDNALVSMDSVEDWFPKAWRLELAPGAAVEPLLSMSGINAGYASDAGLSAPPGPGSYPEERAAEDEQAARALRRAGTALGALVRVRIQALAERPADAARHRGPLALDRVVLGQHLGRLWNDRRTWRYLRSAFELALFATGSLPLNERYCERLEVRDVTPGTPREQWPLVLRRDFVVASRLRAPGAVGAAVAAWRAWSGHVS